jgi:hypothetical protein
VAARLNPVLIAESFIHRNNWLPGVIVAVVLFVLGTGFTVFLRYRDKVSKTLDYQMVSDLSLLVKRPNNLKVVYYDQEVQNPRVVSLKFVNTGKQVIKEAEFLEPCVITCKDTKLLDIEIKDESANMLVKTFDSCESG